MQLWNTSNLPLQTHYAGICYRFAPGERKTIENHKVVNRREGRVEEVHLAEDIGSRLYEDLQQLGLVRIDANNPVTDEQLERLGEEALVAFVTNLIDEFNALNTEIAQGGGKKIIAVPAHYRALQKERFRLLQKLGQDVGDAEDFISRDELKSMQERSKAALAGPVNDMIKALQSGNPKAIQAAAAAISAGQATESPSEFVGDTTPGEFAEHTSPNVGRLPRRAKPSAK